MSTLRPEGALHSGAAAFTLAAPSAAPEPADATGPEGAPTMPRADDCVSKATDSERLLARIRRLLRRRHGRLNAA